MIEIFILAIALSMDAFAVSIGLGAKQGHSRILVVRASIYFGVFQGLMPLIGFLVGNSLLGWIEHFAHLIAFVLLAFIGGKMIYEAFDGGMEEGIDKVTHRLMLVLAFATSIDAMAAGFTLNLLESNPYIACAIIGFTTALFSALGVRVGAESGLWLESRAEFLGGIILIGIGVKMMF